MPRRGGGGPDLRLRGGTRRGQTGCIVKSGPSDFADQLDAGFNVGFISETEFIYFRDFSPFYCPLCHLKGIIEELMGAL